MTQSRLLLLCRYGVKGFGPLLLQTVEGLLTASGLGIPFYAIIRHATAPSVRDGEWTAATKDFTATIGTMEKLVYRSSERGTHNESRYEPDQLVRGSTDESLTLFESTCKRKVKI